MREIRRLCKLLLVLFVLEMAEAFTSTTRSSKGSLAFSCQSQGKHHERGYAQRRHFASPRGARQQPSTELSAILDIVGTSPEPLHTAFTVATFFPQPFWVLLILFPKADVTKKIMGGMGTFLSRYTM